MATPKKKVSKSRRNMRRFSAAYKLDKVTVSTCSSCSEPKRPHTVCKCGHYDGKSVFSGKEAKA
jgi:large subunit ribosomal protein L32